MIDNYLADDLYDGLVADLLAARDPDRVKELLGEVGGVWPASIREDQPQIVTFQHQKLGTVTGTYEVKSGMVYVTYRGKTKPTQIGGLSPEMAAELRLADMVREEAA